MTRQAIADGWLRRQPLTAEQALPPPEQPLPAFDPVLGPPLERNDDRQYGQVWHKCAVHQAEWRGDGGCWACGPSDQLND